MLPQIRRGAFARRLDLERVVRRQPQPLPVVQDVHGQTLKRVEKHYLRLSLRHKGGFPGLV